MYQTDKLNAADVSSRHSDYTNEVEENTCLSMLQNKLQTIETLISERIHETQFSI